MRVVVRQGFYCIILILCADLSVEILPKLSPPLILLEFDNNNLTNSCLDSS